MLVIIVSGTYIVKNPGVILNKNSVEFTLYSDIRHEYHEKKSKSS